VLVRIWRWRPVMRPRATMSAITPTTTPSTEMAEMTEMKACLRRAVRYRSAISSSYGIALTDARRGRRGFAEAAENEMGARADQSGHLVALVAFHASAFSARSLRPRRELAG